MSRTGPLARAARALVQWPRAHVACIAGLEEDALAPLEAGRSVFGDLELARLRGSLGWGGAAFNARDVRAIVAVGSDAIGGVPTA